MAPCTLTLTHKKDLRELVSGLSFCLKEQDKAALIGEEGNGKSTLLKLLYEEALVEDYAEYTGSIQKDGMRLGYLPQELTEEEKELSVYAFCSGKPYFYELQPKELSRMAGRLRLSPELFYSEQSMGSLSGGERVKIQMACALLGEPDALLLDEPTGDLDLEALRWLEELVRDVRIPVLYISHDEVFLERTANLIIHLEQGRRKTVPRASVVRSGYREYVESRSLQASRQEQKARNERRESAKRQERFRRIQQKVEHRQNSVSRQDPHSGYLLKKKMRAVKAQERRFEKEAQSFTEFPDLEDAVFVRLGEQSGIPAGKRVLLYEREVLRAGGRELARNLRLEVTGPKKICITGQNGAGKSTLLKELAEMLLKRTDIHACYMPQNYEELLSPDMTPAEFLAETGEKEEQDRIRTFLGSMKYTADEMLHPIRALSGGQKAKLLLLKMSLSPCDVLILDEPTRNFSPLSAPVIRRVWKEFPGAILSVSHDRRYMEEVCDTFYELTPEGLLRYFPEDTGDFFPCAKAGKQL